MALAIDGSTPAAATGTGTSISTASFTPPVGALIVLLYAANTTGTTADVSISSVTNTGTAVTWTRRARKNKNAASDGGAGQPGGAEIWSGVAPGGAITVTANGFGSGSGAEKFLKAVVITGADAGSLSNVAAAHAASGLPSVTVAACLAGSHVLAVSSDWQALGLGTAGSGQTMMDESRVAGQMTMHSWRTTSVRGASGSQTMNLTAPSGQQYNVCSVEIRDAAGGGQTVAPDGILAPIALGDPSAGWSGAAAPDGVSAAVALGDPSAAAQSTVAPDGFPVPVSLGSASLVWSAAVAPDGLAVPVAVGAPIVGAASVNPGGLPVPLALGDPTLGWSASVASDGIGVSVALGAPIVVGVAPVAPGGITVPVVLGLPSLSWSGAVAADGVSVLVAVGAPGVSIPGAVVVRPFTGTVAKPAAGVVARPLTGAVVRPGSGVVVRPDIGVVSRP